MFTIIIAGILGLFIMLVGGILALIGGNIIITRNLQLKGKAARYYGLTLLLLCVPFQMLVSFIFTSLITIGLMPIDGFLVIILNLVCVLAFIAGLTFLFRRLNEANPSLVSGDNQTRDS